MSDEPHLPIDIRIPSPRVEVVVGRTNHGYATAPADSTSDFAQLKQAFAADPQLAQELQWLLHIAVENFNPSSRANRFIIGALVEWGIALAAFSAGILTLPQGHDADGDDVAGLRDAAKYRWSVKSSFSKQRSYQFIVQNVRGRKEEGRTEGKMEETLFLHPLLPGIVHVDPLEHQQVLTSLRFDGDAWVLPLQALQDHAQACPDHVIPLVVPPNPGAKEVDPAMDIIRALVMQPHFQRLGSAFRQQAAKSRSDVVERLQEVKRMEQQGLLSAAQAQAAINAVLGMMDN
ncbi:hypothetical protein ASE25_05515 [Terrabacter sp. Root85]|uniref:hypothetical protein n=1 Tax=Terrabacter sp. Root85 TaxID=1736603 RepID=UPI0006FA16DC|nr:hypothetical protein [Terrabacter sp. Root85]KRC92760.1 hypothetical protein ASE25_05515 [Terrabacter sp. Root85]